MTALDDAVSFTRGPAMKNRFMLAPLTNQQSHDDGTLSDNEHHWLTMRAEGGFGLVMTCAAHVQKVGQGFAGQLGVFDDVHIDGLTRLARDLKSHDTVAVVQLHHAGHRSPAALIGSDPVCPSDDPETGARGLSTGEVEQLVDDFVTAAVRCERAGFDGVELHGAHDYMICEFLNPDLNRRDDKYGGSLENRARMLMEIVAGIRERCGADFNLSVRLSPERFGMRTAEIVEVYSMLVDSGHVDFIDMSLWDVFKKGANEGFEEIALLDLFAGVERGETRLAVAGKLYSAEDCRRALDGGADMVVIGRGAILHHDFPRLAADPTFQVRSLPASRDVLAAEGLSETFIGYMGNWPGFVGE